MEIILKKVISINDNLQAKNKLKIKIIVLTINNNSHSKNKLEINII